MGFSRQERQNGLPCPPAGDLPDPGIKLASLMSPALAVGFFTTGTTWEAQYPVQKNTCIHAWQLSENGHSLVSHYYILSQLTLFNV